MKRRHFLKTAIFGFAGMNTLFSHDINPIKSEKQEKKLFNKTDVVVKILGTAQDGGIPQIGCACKNCVRAHKNPQHVRLVSSLAILDLYEKKLFLIDATPDIPTQLYRALKRLPHEQSGEKNSPHAVLLSHAHIGHYTGLMFFGYEAMSTHKLPVYCSSRMKNFLTNNGPWSQLVSLENISLHTFSSDETLHLSKQISVSPFPVPHRNEFSDTFGFIISGKKRKILYIPDIQGWDVWDRSIVQEVKKVDIALLDGTFFNSDELPERDLSQIGHPFIKTTLHTLRNVPKERKKEIYFTHLNHSNLALDPEGEARREIKEKGFKLALDGMEFFI